MKWRIVWIIAVVAAVCVAAAAVVWLLVPRSPSAEDQAMAYFAALADGDLAAVQASGVAIDNEAAAAFAGASEYPRSAEVESSDAANKATTVTVAYRLGEEQLTAEIVMVDRAGQWMPEPASALGAVTFDEPVAIGDAVLESDAAIALLPASYEVDAVPADFLAGSASVVVLPGKSEDVAIVVTLRPEATARAQEQLNDYAEACTQTGTEVPASCGIVIPWAADFTAVSTISYRVEQLPTLALTLNTFHAGDGILVATVTGVGIDGAEQSRTYRTSTWSIRGDVAFTADDIALSVW